MIQGQILFLGNINAYSLIWNLYCQRRKNIKSLEEFIKKFDLFINNISEQITRPASDEVSIINLALSKVKLGFVTL